MAGPTRTVMAMDLGLTGEVGIVTVSTKGIGKVIAIYLARAGVDLDSAARSD